jgi:polysaccharide biosynthesis/export protein
MTGYMRSLLVDIQRNKAGWQLLFIVFLFAAAGPAVLAADQLTIPAAGTGAPAAEFSRREYLIGPGDQLEIKFFYNSELDETVAVDPGGNIGLQLIGQVHALGLTAKELQADLESRYASQLAKPQVTVLVKSFAREKVFVQGEVQRPGVVELAGPMTVLQAIATVGGLKETAKEKDILIIRFPRGQGTPTIIRADLRGILRGREPLSDLVLAPMDVVYVSRSHIANLNLWVDQHVRKNIPVTAGVLWSPLGGPF